jgi:class 3 adenylate cyclase
MVVRYDGRGSGMSDRDIADLSLEAQTRDLEAVIERLGLQRFALLGYIDSGVVAIGYAVRHPERVSHLVLWGSQARGSHIRGEQTPYLPGIFALLENDWDLFVATASHLMFGLPTGDLDPQVADFIRQSTTAEAVRAAFEASSQSDVAALLPQVRSPTLVLHPRQIPWLPSHLARELASGIPDAQLTLVEGLMWWGDQWEPVLAAIDEFWGESEAAEPKAELPEAGAFRTILFTDVEGSTALTDRLGDARARELLREHERMVREALKAHGGSEIKTMGDGFMASFSSATKALECAIAMQRAFAKHNDSAPEPILVRVGLNAGEPIAEEEDLHGTAVIEAARITAAAAGGEILVANVVRELAKGKDFLFADRGETSLRGFEDPVRLFEVRWREDA